MLALALVLFTAPALIAAAPAPPDGAAGPGRTVEERVAVPGGPGTDAPVELDTTLYLPEVTPAPAVLVAHGFGGSKASVDEDARALAARGFVALAWSARGFGASTGEIALNSPDHEVADARALVDRLAGMPEVTQDGPDDPRVGATGGSYGGALSLLLAGTDPRVDAIAPVITWNDLGQALFPNAAATVAPPLDTPARGAFAADGVFKRGWAGVFFSAGLGTPAPAGVSSGAAPAGAVPTGVAPTGVAPDPTCGRFTAEVCAAYTDAATTGRLSPATAALLERSSPRTVTGRITAPTLLVQGEQDTLFGLDQADANAREIAANGTPVQMRWYAGGHDGGAAGPEVTEAIGTWFDAHLAGGEPVDPAFPHAVESGLRAGSNTTTGRTVVAADYPGLTGASTLTTRSLALDGDRQVIATPAGGSPAAITSLPGVGAALGSLGSRLSAVAGALPGQSARFATPVLDAPLLVTGAPRVELTVARVPGQPAPAEAVLFAATSEVTPDGTRTLLGSAVAPLRVAVPADGTPATVTVTLPGVVAPVEAGNRLVVSVATTDQAYAGGTDPAAWAVAVNGGLTVPEVPGRTVTANTVPPGPAVGIAVVLGLALAAWGTGWLVRRRGAAVAVDRPDADPLVIEGLAKTYRGGFSAVKGVTFRVRSGQVLGLLGPNGAGKTTVLRMLMGLIRPTAGTITAFGQPVGPGAPVLARIGAFVEGPGFLPHLSGADNLRLYWAATGRPATEAHLDEALEIAGLGPSVQRRVGTYSQGMRQRLAIAQAMLGLPDMLVLDEPTNGLDPPQIHAMREVLRRYAAGGRTVLVSSHLLAEVEQTCDHVVVMHHGRVVADGSVEDIIAGGGAATFTVDAPTRAATVLGDLDGVRAVEIDGAAVHAELNGTPRASAVRALVTAGVDVASAGPRRRLEDAFLQLVGEETVGE
ncbi:CocE/NonD family hydrolase [Pseudonocardia hydrocarbonoxydans]|uniref:ABC transporter ATP-binding protein n=1 Tax=Pseudonocardia hydrocarbonoxydans TaxID=76726 RepID=A0A4Y3WH92_9PSEU|nr:ABC transporter ATP-binding protein [Pseudonocardia hydrocarbonoxydans]